MYNPFSASVLSQVVPQYCPRALVWLAAITILCSASSLIGQTANGGIRGNIQDSDFLMPVSGAKVFLEPGGMGVTTDSEGSFFLSNLPPGAYRLVAIRDGYVRASVNNLVVSPGNIKETSIDMIAEVVELDEFVVELEIEQEASVITPITLGASLQTMAATLGVEAFRAAGSTGDIGNLTKRLASTAVVDSRYVVIRGLSDRYNVVVLNGARIPSSDPDKRAVNIDIFPTGLVENLVSAKTYIPAMPGETTGGYLNIITKRIPEKPFFRWSVSNAYNTGTTGKMMLTDPSASTGLLGTASERAIPAAIRGFDQSTLPAGNPQSGPLSGQNTTTSGTTTNLSTGVVTATNPQNLIFQRNRQIAANALAGRSTGVGVMEAPTNFSFSAIGGTRIEDFMGGTLGLVGGVTYTKRYQTDIGVRGAARVVNSATGQAQETQYWEYEKGQESILAGALLSASLEFSPENSVSLTYFANVAAEDEAIFARGENSALGTVANGVPLSQEDVVLYRENLIYTERQLKTLQLTGTHKLSHLGDIQLDWFATYSMSSQDQPDARKSIYSYNYSNGTFGNAGDPAPPEFERVWRKLNDTNYNVGMNVDIPLDGEYGKERPSSKLELGGSMDYSTRDYDTQNFEYEVSQNYLDSNLVPRLARPALPSGTTLADTLGRNDSLDAVTSTRTVGAGANQRIINTVTDLLFLARGVNLPVSESYTASQSIPAAYASITFAMKDNFEVYSGARLEATNIRVNSGTQFNALDPNSNAGQLLLADPITGDRLPLDKLANPGINRTDLLPALGVKWSIADHHVVRASISRTVARPTFKEIAPAISRDPESGDLFVGYVLLDMSSIVNYDLRWEWDMGRGDLLAVTAFAKSINKPIENVYTGLFNTVRNDDSATLYGFEIELNKRLGDIAPFLEGLNYSMNYGYVFSQVNLNASNEANRKAAGLATTRPLQGQPKYTFNANLSQENKDLGITSGILLNITGPLLYSVGGRAAAANLDAPDVFQRTYTSVDAYISKSLSKNWDLNFRVANLLDAPRQRYFSGNLPYSDIKTGTVYSIGLSGKW